MGLSLSVGYLEEVRGDAEGEEWARAKLAQANRALARNGQSTYEEPAEVPDSHLTCGGDMLGYSGLHYLRRIAAHLWAGRKVPTPGDENASQDLTLRRYYDRAGKPMGTARRGWFRRRPPEAPRFDHLILHSDAEGLYVPVDFEEVIFAADDEPELAGMLGSSQRLLAECNVLADALEIPPELGPDDEVVHDAIQTQGSGVGWQRYGYEVYSCLRLQEAARGSVEIGAALVFC